MKSIFAFLVITLAASSAIASESPQSLTSTLDEVLKGVGGEASKIHLIGVDQKGRLCEASFGDLTTPMAYLALGFDRVKSGSPEYIDNYLLLNYRKDFIRWNNSDKEPKITIENLNAQTLAVEEKLEIKIFPTYGRTFAEGSITLERGNRKDICKFQRLINNYSADAKLLLREGAIYKFESKNQ